MVRQSRPAGAIWSSRRVTRRCIFAVVLNRAAARVLCPGAAGMSGQQLDLGCLPEVTVALAAGAEANDRTGAFPAAGIEAVHAPAC